MKGSKTVSIVTPCYNEEANIVEFYKEAKKASERLKDYNFEFVFSNDGSKDNTERLILDLRKDDSRVKVISLSRNYGQEIALLAGLDNAKGDAVIIFDADLQDPLTLIDDFLIKWEEGYEVVNAKRLSRDGETWLKKFTSDLFYTFYDWILPNRIKCPRGIGHCRLLDRKVVDAFCSDREQLRFFRGAIAYIGFKTTEVEFKRNARNAGQTKYNYKTLIRYALDGFVGYTNKPLYIPIVFAVISFAIFVYCLIIGNMLVSAMMLISTFIFITLTVFAEYLAQIYNEVKGRKLYHTRIKEVD